MIVTSIPDSTKPDVVDFLRKNLIKRGIVSSYGRRRKHKIKNKEAFMKIFKAFFIAWIYNNFQFEGKSNFCFVRLDRKNTLLLLPPKNIITGYLNENNKSFYKNNIFEGIESSSKDFTGGCIISNFLNFNLSQFKQKGLTVINHTSKNNCPSCFKKHSRTIAKQIKTEQNLGLSLGGYPILIDDVSSDLIRDLLKAYLAEASTRTEISEPLDSLLLAFICIYFGSIKKFGGARTNCVVCLDTFQDYDPIKKSNSNLKVFSKEIDAIIYSQQKKVLIAIELTTLHKNAFKQSFDSRKGKQFPEHFKKTINNFNVLFHYSDNRNIKFKGIYLTLVNFSDEMKKESEYYVLRKNRSFVHLNFNKQFEELKSVIETDNLTNTKIDTTFNKFINRLEKAIK